MAKKGMRARTRQLALQALYQRQIAATELDDLLCQFKASESYRRVEPEFFEHILRYVVANETALEEQLVAHSDRDPALLDPVGRAALLIGLAELAQGIEPKRVIINEAVELAKTYGPTDCHRFVNAVLDKVRDGAS